MKGDTCPAAAADARLAGVDTPGLHQCVRPRDEPHSLHVNGYGQRWLVQGGRVHLLA